MAGPELARFALGLALALAAYTYIGYPLLLRLIAAFRPPAAIPEPPAEWPAVCITLAAHNEERRIGDTLENLLRLEYPPGERQILVVSDASTDRTDEIVAGFADRGVELLRLDTRGGKTAAENAARFHVRGDIVVNTDAAVHIDADALTALVARFADPEVGVASARDISIAPKEQRRNSGESHYVGYEMRIRELETRVHGIVGASGCLYAIRAELHRAVHVPEHLSRDFMAALTAREHGFRSVSVHDATCVVPRTGSLRREHRRKVRTITRGMQTLLYMRHLLNPFRFGVFAWMLFSHKICRWVTPWAGLLAGGGLFALAPSTPWAAATLAALGLGCVLAGIGWVWPEHRSIPRALALAAYLASGNLATCRAAVRALRGRGAAVWEPTRRGRVEARTAGS